MFVFKLNKFHRKYTYMLSQISYLDNGLYLTTNLRVSGEFDIFI
jgi:hypothetical protein